VRRIGLRQLGVHHHKSQMILTVKMLLANGQADDDDKLAGKVLSCESNRLESLPEEQSW
jgi:hypothetical protein